jgi:hypothetical protein
LRTNTHKIKGGNGWRRGSEAQRQQADETLPLYVEPLEYSEFPAREKKICKIFSKPEVCAMVLLIAGCALCGRSALVAEEADEKEKNA